MKDWTVFLGPSLDPVAAQATLDATYAPPIRRGDLEAHWSAGARKFAIIDGEFAQSLSVTLTEIRDVLRRGGVVCGASSMGALRACEGRHLGMHGLGWVYRAFVDGQLFSDDEVALTFDADSRRALTVPLVNLRWALHRQVCGGRLSPAAAASLVDLAKATHFSERALPRLVRAAEQLGSRDVRDGAIELLARVRSRPAAYDRKRLDAVLLLRAIARRGHVLEPTAVPTRVASNFVGEVAISREQWLGTPSSTRKAPGTHRQLAAHQLVDVAVHSARSVGVSRLADVGSLDVLGIHTWNSVRPFAEEHDNTVTGGKGLSRDAAVVSACLEAVERDCMTPTGRPEYFGTFEERSAHATALHPRDLVLDYDSPWREQEPLYWWPMCDVSNGESVWVPATNVFFPFTKGPRLHSQCSTGLAAGASRTEALLYGLLEVLERHATTRFHFVRRATPVTYEYGTSDALDALHRRLVGGGVVPHVWLLESEVDVPTVRVVLDDTEQRSPSYLAGGYACHPDPLEAIQGAMLEALFARSSVIAGSREDLAEPASALERLGYERARQEILDVQQVGAPLTLRALADRSSPSIAEDLDHVLLSVRRAGLERVLASDLSRQGLPVCVARCVVPGLAFAPTGKRISPYVVASLRRFGPAFARRGKESSRLPGNQGEITGKVIQQ